MKKVLIIFFFLISALVHATTYYVSTSGSDSNNGLTTTTPWLTLQYAESHATAPGDIIALKRGDVWASTTALAVKHSGSSGNTITWDGSLWGSGAIASVKSSANRSSGNDAVVNIIACSYVTFKNITVDGNNTRTYGLVIGGHSGFSNNAQNNENHITVDGCAILNCGNGGDYRLGFLCQTWGTNISDITIQNCTLDGSDDEQLSFYPGKSQDGGTPMECKNIVVRNNTLTNWGRRGQSTGYGMQINNKCTTVLIENNTLNQGATGKGDALHIESNELVTGYIPTGVTVRYNKFTIGRPNEWCVIIQQGQGKTVDMYANQFASTSTSSTSGGNIWIIISSPNYSGAHLNFDNNTFYTRSGITYQDDSSTPGACNFKNNIVYNAGTGSDYCYIANVAGSTIHNNNLYYRSGTGDVLLLRDGGNYKYQSTVTAWEPTSKDTDPLFNNLSGTDYSLQSGSPAIGSGVSISGIASDLVGKSYSNPPSMGAFESSSSAPAVPVYVSSAIQNATPSSLEMTYSSTLAAVLPASSAFTVMVNSVARSVSSVALSGAKVTLALATPVVNGDVVTVTYTKPASNPLQSISGGQAASLSSQPVTNNISASAPVFVSAAVQNATPANLEMTYNSTLATVIPAASAFTVMVNSVARVVSTVAVSGAKVTLTLASAVANGNVVTVAYTKPATNPLQNISGGQAVSLTAQSVTNNVSASLPVYVSSAIQNVTPANLEMTYNSTLATTAPASSAFTVMVNSVARSISSVAVSGAKVTLTLASAVINGDVVTVAYTKPATNPLQNASGGQAVSLTAQAVTNNVSAAVPVYVSSAVQNTTPAILEMTYSSTLATVIPPTSAFSVLVNSAARTVSTVGISGTKVSLTLASPIVYGDVLKVTYTIPATNPLQFVSGGQAASLTSQSVTNNVSSPVAIPAYVSSAVQDAAPTKLEMTYNTSLASIIPDASAFIVMVNSVARTVSAVAVSGTKVTLTLSSAVLSGNVVTVSYNKPVTNPLQTTAGGQAASISAQPTTNNIVAPVVPPSDAKIAMTIYPNPVHHIINIQMVYTNSSTGQAAAVLPEIIRIFNSYGRLSFEKLIPTGAANVRFSINLRSGVYNVVLLSGGVQMASKRIMVYQ